MLDLTIISGAQTGVDRGALIAAALQGYKHGGWCPKGRKAEDGVIPPCYPVTEAPSARYEDRTLLNVECSDATLLLTYEHYDHLTGGTALTKKLVMEQRKKLMIVTLERDASVELDKALARKIRDWLRHEQPKILNVAGPRESKARGIQNHTAQVVSLALQTKARCLCGRQIPPMAWLGVARMADAPLQCSSCGHRTWLRDVDQDTSSRGETEIMQPSVPVVK